MKLGRTIGIQDRGGLIEADYGKIAIYIMIGTRTFDTCLGMTQGVTQSWKEESQIRQQ
jgi:hypothetical protein